MFLDVLFLNVGLIIPEDDPKKPNIGPKWPSLPYREKSLTNWGPKTAVLIRAH